MTTLFIISAFPKFLHFFYRYPGGMTHFAHAQGFFNVEIRKEN